MAALLDALHIAGARSLLAAATLRLSISERSRARLDVRPF